MKITRIVAKICLISLLSLGMLNGCTSHEKSPTPLEHDYGGGGGAGGVGGAGGHGH